MKITSLELKYYLEILGKGFITSMCLNTIRRSKRKKNSKYAIINVIIKDLSKIIKEFDDLTYEDYLWKSSKHEPTDSYFYVLRQIAKCMVRFNKRVGSVRTQITNTQTMNNQEISTQNILNSHVCSSYKRKSKMINANESLLRVCSEDNSESKEVIVNACYSYKCKSKSIHISLNKKRSRICN